MRYNKLLFYSLVLGLLLIPLVYAATDPLSAVLEPFANFDLAAVYDRFGVFVDFLAYAILFISVATFSLKKVYGENKTIPVVIGAILGVAATVGAQGIGFELVALGPFALALALAIIAVATFKLISGFGIGDKGTAAAWAYIVVYGFILTAASPLFDLIKEQSKKEGFAMLGVAPALLSLLFIFAFIWALKGAISAFRPPGGAPAGGGGGGGLGGDGAQGAGGGGPPSEPKGPEDIERDLRDEGPLLQEAKTALQEAQNNLGEVEKTVQGKSSTEQLAPQEIAEAKKKAGRLRRAAGALKRLAKNIANKIRRESKAEQKMSGAPQVIHEAENRALVAGELEKAAEKLEDDAGNLEKAVDSGKVEVIAEAAAEAQKNVNQADKDRQLLESTRGRLSRDIQQMAEEGRRGVSAMWRWKYSVGPKAMSNLQRATYAQLENIERKLVKRQSKEVRNRLNSAQKVFLAQWLRAVREEMRRRESQRGRSEMAERARDTGDKILSQSEIDALLAAFGDEQDQPPNT